MKQIKKAMQLLTRTLYQLTALFEGVISLTILICIGIELVTLIDTYQIFTADLTTVQLKLMLGDIMWLVIGLEFIRMLLEHSQGAVLDVMLFAIARQMLLEHGMLDNLLAVIAIAIVFAVRKFLYDKSVDHQSLMDQLLGLLKDDKSKEVLGEAIGDVLEDTQDNRIEQK